MRYIKLSVFLILLSGCSHSKYILKHQDEIRSYLCVNDTVRSIEKDTIIKTISEYYIEPDFATMDMFFECDSLNNVLLTKVDSLSGKRTVIRYVLVENKLTIKALTDSISGIIANYDTLKTKTIYLDRPITIEKRVEVSFWWHWVLHGIALMLILFLLFRK